MKPHLSLRVATLAAVILPILALLARPMTAAPEPKGLGDPGKLQSIRIDTGRTSEGRFVLTGPDAAQQLLITGTFSSGQVRDLTRTARYASAPAGIVAIDAAGVVTPLKDGEADITAEVDGAASVRIGVNVTRFADAPRVGFANEVMPIFTKLGCNTGGCHGKASGQNGFKLSLFGFEPGEDYEYIVKEGRGRRVFVSAPDSSLLLLKPTGQIAHGGGKRLEKGSPSYALLRRWIAEGAPNDRTRLSERCSGSRCVPRERLLDRGGSQQLIVVAHLSDGSTARRHAPGPVRGQLAGDGRRDAGRVGHGKRTTRQRRHHGPLSVPRRRPARDVPLGAPVANLPPARNFIDRAGLQAAEGTGSAAVRPCATTPPSCGVRPSTLPAGCRRRRRRCNSSPTTTRRSTRN